jgi:hypothetical protein
VALFPPGTVRLDPVEIATGRTPLDLNSGLIRTDAAGIGWPVLTPTTYEAEQQKYGSSVVEFRVPNAQVTIPLMVGDGTSGGFEQGLGQLREKVGLLIREGGWLGRSSSAGNLYADIVSAQLTLPDVWGEAAGREPNVQLVVECLPDFYSDPVDLDVVFGAGEVSAVLTQAGAQATVAGDYPGRATVTVTDQSGSPQFGVLWAFQSRYYSAAGSAGLAYSPAGAAFTPGPGASVQTLSGARGGTAIEQPACGSSGTAVASMTGTHEGTLQAFCRVYAPAAGTAVQWLWGLGDSASTYANAIVPLPGAGWWLVNVGQVRVPPPAFGSPQWQGQLLGFSSGGTVALWWDMLYLQPLDESAGVLLGLEPAGPVILADGSLQARFDGVQRSTSFQGVYAPVSAAVGDLPRIPPSGMEGRAVRLLAKPSRGDLSSYQDSASQDPFTVQVTYRPCYVGRL